MSAEVKTGSPRSPESFTLFRLAIARLERSNWVVCQHQSQCIGVVGFELFLVSDYSVLDLRTGCCAQDLDEDENSLVTRDVWPVSEVAG